MIFKAKVSEAYARMEWCKEHIGRGGYFDHIDSRWYRKGGYLFFKYEEDYLLYQLRWSRG